MPLDHYVPQVHLRQWCSPALGNRMYAIRKADLKTFTPDSQSVCRITDGSTNAYLRNNRAVEIFLKTIEPNYNAALEQLASGNVDSQCIYTIAGFVAYIIACSPAGMRIQSGPLRNLLDTTAAILDARGALPPPPPQLGDSSLTELLSSGAVELTVDPKYSQAIGVSLILRRAALFGNFKWEILRNPIADSPFFTSDFPAAIEVTDDPRVLNRIVPLCPTLALRIRPDLMVDSSRSNFSFSNFDYQRRDLGREETTRLNRLIVRCAEETTFYRDDHPWIRPFIAKNRHYRIEPFTQRIATPTGKLLVFTHRIVAAAAQAESTS